MEWGVRKDGGAAMVGGWDKGGLKKWRSEALVESSRREKGIGVVLS